MTRKYVLGPLLVACTLYLLLKPRDIITVFTFLKFVFTYPSCINSTSTTFVRVLEDCICPRSKEFWNSVKAALIRLSAICKEPHITPSITSGFSA